MSSEFEWEKPERTLNFAVIKDDLDKLFRATENKCEREWPSHLGADMWHAGPFLFSLKTARWTYLATCYLLADSPQDPKRHLEYSIVVPPINRTILDMVFNFVFIFDNFQERLCWYLDSGHQQSERKLALLRNTYGNDPSWMSFFDTTGAMTSPFKQNRDIVCRGKTLKNKGPFPHPGRIVGNQIPFNDPKALEFLKYLKDWFYRDLSSSAHAHWSGLAERVAQVLRMETKDETQKTLAQKYKSDCMLQQITLVLCLLSETIAAARFDNRPQAAYLWSILSNYWGEAKELYALRYQSLLV